MSPGAAVLFGALLLVYVAGEASTTAWSPTHVAAQFDVARGALAASVFWLAMTVGRFSVAAAGSAWRPRDLVFAASVLGLAGLVVAGAPGMALVGYAIAGLGLGPIFPTSVVWVSERFGDRAEQVGSWVLAAGNLGPVVGAPAVGLAVAGFGAEAIPVVLASVMALLVVLVAVTWWGDRRAAPLDRGAPAGAAAASDAERAPKG